MTEDIYHCCHVDVVTDVEHVEKIRVRLRGGLVEWSFVLVFCFRHLSVNGAAARVRITGRNDGVGMNSKMDK